jgi:hypothetical protein
MWEEKIFGEFEVPENFKCPITLEIMKEPVMTSDGQSYEKKDILNWLEKNNTSPLTGVILQNKQIIDNFALKKIINDYVES